MSQPRVAVVASYVTELIFHVPRLMRLGESLMARFQTGYGGKGFNMAVAAHRAGAHTSVIMKVGMDEFGATAVSLLERQGIGTDFVYRDPVAPSGAGVVLLEPSGNNAIALDPGANDTLSADEVSAAASAIAGARVVLAPLEVPVAAVTRAFEIARDRGVSTILNPAPAPAAGLPGELLRAVDVLTPNESEAETLTGCSLQGESGVEAAAERLLASGVGAVAITLGERGAYYASASGRGFVPAPPVTPVDTTGAGDAFNGALAVALAEGLALPDAVRFGVAVASLKVTQKGSSQAMPARAEIDAFIASRAGK